MEDQVVPETEEQVIPAQPQDAIIAPPVYIIVYVFSFCDEQTRAKLKSVCKKFEEAVFQLNLLWRYDQFFSCPESIKKYLDPLYATMEELSDFAVPMDWVVDECEKMITYELDSHTREINLKNIWQIKFIAEENCERYKKTRKAHWHQHTTFSKTAENWNPLYLAAQRLNGNRFTESDTDDSEGDDERASLTSSDTLEFHNYMNMGSAGSYGVVDYF